MIIELTGLPGVGKSTILKGIKEYEFKEAIVFDVENFIKNISLFKLNGTIGYDIILLLKFYKLEKIDCKILLKSLIILKSNKNSFKYKVNIYRNILKKLIIFRILKNKEEIFLVDEGVSHIGMSLFVDIKSEIIESKVVEFYKNLPKPDRILLIDADDSILLTRVIKRGKEGHARIDFSNKNNIKLFMSKSRNIVEVLKQQLKPEIYMNTNVNPNILGVIKLMNIRNV